MNLLTENSTLPLAFAVCAILLSGWITVKLVGQRIGYGPLLFIAGALAATTIVLAVWLFSLLQGLLQYGVPDAQQRSISPQLPSAQSSDALALEMENRSLKSRLTERDAQIRNLVRLQEATASYGYLGTPPSQTLEGNNSMLNNPGQLWGGNNSFVRNPSKLAEELAESDAERDFIRHQRLRLNHGEIVFNPPKHMREGKSEPVTIRIARSMIEKGILESLQGSGAPQSQHISVGDVMSVRLEAVDHAFEITSRSPEEQAIQDTGYNEWRFDVVPKKADMQILEVQASVKLTLGNGTTEPSNIVVIDRKISVEVDPYQPIRNFFSSDETIRWLIGGGLAVIFTAAFWKTLWSLGRKIGAARRWFWKRIGR